MGLVQKNRSLEIAACQFDPRAELAGGEGDRAFGPQFDPGAIRVVSPEIRVPG
jgi:hypothetical protein